MRNQRGHKAFYWCDAALRVVLLCFVMLVTFDLVVEPSHDPVEMNTVEVVTNSGDQDSDRDVVKQLVDDDLIEFHLAFFEFVEQSAKLKSFDQFVLSNYLDTFSPPPEC